MKSYFISGLKVFHNEVYGATVPTVAIHGACASGEIWDSISERFAKKKKPLFALTLPDHSETVTSQLGKHTLSVYASAVSRFIREQIGECNILAYSMGGVVAQLLDPSADARVKRRVLVGTPPAGKPLISPALGLRAIKYLPAFIFGWPWKYTRQDYIELLCNELDPPVAESLYAGSVKESGWAALQMLTGRTPVQNITGNILVVSFWKDLIVPSTLQGGMSGMYPNVQVDYQSSKGCHLSLFAPDHPVVDKILAWLYPPPQ